MQVHISWSCYRKRCGESSPRSCFWLALKVPLSWPSCPLDVSNPELPVLHTRSFSMCEKALSCTSRFFHESQSVTAQSQWRPHRSFSGCLPPFWQKVPAWVALHFACLSTTWAASVGHSEHPCLREELWINLLWCSCISWVASAQCSLRSLLQGAAGWFAV